MIRNHALVDLTFKDSENSFYYGETENKRGASDIPPERIAARILEIIK